MKVLYVWEVRIINMWKAYQKLMVWCIILCMILILNWHVLVILYRIKSLRQNIWDLIFKSFYYPKFIYFEVLLFLIQQKKFKLEFPGKIYNFYQRLKVYLNIEQFPFSCNYWSIDKHFKNLFITFYYTFPFKSSKLPPQNIQ